jgi:hypothetical protein
MGQGRLYQAICLHILLIASAIQAVTPDAQDLASLNPLRILCRSLAERDTLADDDELPDDACEPMSAEIDVVARQQAESAGVAIRVRPAAACVLTACRSGAAISSADLGKAHRSDGLIYTLCRLIC